MNEKSLELIEDYKNFRIGSATCSIPYYNNRHIGIRGGFRVKVGKGSVKEIQEEVQNIITLQKINLLNLNDINLKKFLVDHTLGIDCSGFAYHVLNEESIAREKGFLEKNLTFQATKGLFGKYRTKIRPAENTSVTIFADDKNSTIIDLKNILPGDMVTMIGGEEKEEKPNARDHIIILTKIEYENNLPKIIHYTHSIAWPTDGEYGHGVREGIIEITDIEKHITEQKWIENEKTDGENYTWSRARKSQTEIRHLNWF